MRVTYQRLRSLVALLTVTSACSADHPTTAPSSPDPLALKIVAMGFRADMIRDKGSYYLVEGDIRISKASLQEPAQLRPQFQVTSDSLASAATVKKILVDLSGLSTMPAWQTAARQALPEWNRVNCSAVTLAEGTPADIVFRAESFDYHFAANTDLPMGGGHTGDTIRVNTAYFDNPNTASTKWRNMVHEIGHAIGFRHPNWQSIGESATNGHHLVPGTPASDAASVMNGNTATASYAGLSNYDTVAARVIYPGGTCVPSITGPARIRPGSICFFHAPPTGAIPPYTYGWSYLLLGGASVAAYSPSNGTYQVVAENSQGSVKITVIVTDSTGSAGTMTRTIIIDPLAGSC